MSPTKRGLARIAADDLGPLVPRRRTPIAEKEGEQRLRAVAPAQPHERADDAQLVRRVGIPRRLAVAAIGELAPVALVGGSHQLRRKHADVAARRERDRRRRRIEIAELGRSREGIAMPRAAAATRSDVDKIAAKARRARRAGASASASWPSAAREIDRAVVALQRPEVVPIRMHRLFRVSLVADRRRQQPIEAARRPARDWRRCARSAAACPGSPRPPARAATSPRASARSRV